MNGARWAQHDLLDTHPRLDVRVYAREAAWDDRPTHLVSWGYTIMRSRAALLRELDRLASRSP